MFRLSCIGLSDVNMFVANIFSQVKEELENDPDFFKKFSVPKEEGAAAA